MDIKDKAIAYQKPEGGKKKKNIMMAHLELSWIQTQQQGADVFLNQSGAREPSISVVIERVLESVGLFSSS